MRLQRWLVLALSGVAGACGGSARGGGLEEDSGSSTGGRATGGTRSGGAPSSVAGSDATTTGGSGGGTATTTAGAAGSSESGAAGAPLEPRRDCPQGSSGFDWDGPFSLEFSDGALVRTGVDEARCTVITADAASHDGEQSLHLELECLADGAVLDPPEPIPFELSIDFGPLPGFALRPLEPGAVVGFEYDYVANINQPGQHFLLTATDETPGFDAGELILGAVFSDDFRWGFGLGPVTVALGPELCIDERVSFECVQSSLHDLVVTFADATVTASLGETIQLGTSPPLNFRVTGNRTMTATDACCSDCAQDSISFAIWAPG